MKRTTLTKTLLSLVIGASSIMNAAACTVLTYKDAKGNTYQGRTNEYAGMQPDTLSYFPAGSLIQSVTPAGQQGKTFHTKYAVLAVTLNGLTANAKQQMVHEGVNDQGMTFTVNAMINDTSPQVGSDATKVLSVVDLGTWALGNFQSVAQVKQALNKNEVEIWLPRIPSMANFLAPVHLALFDKTGAGIVIEFINGKTTVFDNPVGVMTNDPHFPWHLENLNNYAQLSNVDKNTGKFNSLTVRAHDSGNALAGLPSTQTATGRFVKAAFYSTYARPAKNPAEAIQTLSHVMNNFDRPVDISIDLPGTSSKAEGNGSKSPTSEATYFTVMNDLAQGQFYLRTIKAINFSRFDIAKLSPLTEVKHVPFKNIDANPNIDGTTLFLR